MWLYRGLTMMAVLLFQLVFLTQCRHIGERSTDISDDGTLVCQPKNATRNAAACFLSKDLIRRLDDLMNNLDRHKHVEVLKTVNRSENFRQWYLNWLTCQLDSDWAIDYLLVEALDAVSRVQDDILLVKRRTNDWTNSLPSIREVVKNLLSIVYCEVKSLVENCPLLSGYPVADISREPGSRRFDLIQPERTEEDDFILAKFWVLWHCRVYGIREKANEIAARQIGPIVTGGLNCTQAICVESASH